MRTIEHGNLIDDASAKLMAEKGMFLVANLVTYYEMKKRASEYGMNSDMLAKNDLVIEGALKWLEICKRISPRARRAMASAAATGAVCRRETRRRPGVGEMHGVNGRDRGVGGGQRRRVVQPVADHQHFFAPRFQRLDKGDLVRLLRPPRQSATPSCVGDGRHGLVAVRRREYGSSRRWPNAP